MTDRKPLLVLAALAVVAIVVFVVGAAGAGRSDTGAGWPDWAAPGRSPGDPLTTEDLTGSPSCSIDAVTITFFGSCRVQVRAITQGWPWQAVTRRALLAVALGPVDLTVTLAGRTLAADLDPGDQIRLTYTREGGDFTMVCGNPTGCAVTLLEDA